jgi:hypothetical protein
LFTTIYRKPKALINYILLIVFGLFSASMLFQAYQPRLPLILYIGLITLFIGAIVCAIFFGREVTAAIGIFFFSLVIRLMYYVSTQFAVFPLGDPYSQYTVLRTFSRSSHIVVIASSNFLNFLTRIPHQYSEWPGFQAFSLSLARVTNLPIFVTALIVPFMIYSIWFIVSYAILRKIFSRFTVSASMLALLAIGVAVSLPTFEMPPIFKYDFMAAVLLLGVILLLIHPLGSQILQKSVLLAILISAIVATHSLTAFFLAVIIVLLGIAFIFRKSLPRFWLGSLHLDNRSKIRFPFVKLVFLVIASAAVWWTFYATFVEKYGISHIPAIIGSISLKFLSFSRGGVRRASAVGGLTPHWLLQILHFRDEVLLALVALGAVVLVVRPSILGKRPLVVGTLFSIGIVTVLTEASGALNFGDRAFNTFAPILGCFVFIPIAALALRKVNVARLLGVVILVVFLFTVGLGFWGSSYAPMFLYSKNSSAYSYGGHPTNWPQVAAYMNFATGSSNNATLNCILTNEVYVTSLTVPIQKLPYTYPFTDVRTRPGCVVIVFDTLLHFNSSSYISQPYAPYKNTSTLPAFSDNRFSATLANASDLVFNGGNATIYYVL